MEAGVLCRQPGTSSRAANGYQRIAIRTTDQHTATRRTD
jgi:hypothetical protein